MRPASEEKRYEIAIFDFDGTLLDTPMIYPFIHKELLRELGVPEDEISYITNSYWRREVTSKGEHIDMPAYLSRKHAIDVTPLDFRRKRNQIEREYFTRQRDIEELMSPESYLIKPVISDLRRLSENGTRCFVVSHNYGSVIEFAMESLGLSKLFEDYYTHCSWEELRHPLYDRNEPKGETFARIAGFASDPGVCIVYDDMREHIESAISLGMDAVLVDSEHACPPTGRR